MKRSIPNLLRSLTRGRLAPVFGALERRALEALWRRGPSSVRGIRADFPGTAYTTLMTTLERLFQKGVLDREKCGRAFVYRARYTRGELQSRLAQEALHAFFDREPGALRPALSLLVDAVGRQDERLLAELEALVRKARSGGEGEA